MLMANRHAAGVKGNDVTYTLDHYLEQLDAVNEAFGYPAGDHQPRKVTSAILSTMRGTDCAYRVGGDEFAVILDGTGVPGALKFTQRLDATLTAETSSAVVRHRRDR